MALATYSDLKTAVANWMARGDVSGEAADFIALAEAGLNRELNPVETDTTLTGTLNSRRIDISSLAMVEPIALLLAEANEDEIILTQKSDGSFPYLATAGEPRYWAVDGTNIDFDCPLDEAYAFRFRYRQRFALSDAAPTNWLLTNHPDVYLAASLLWGGVFTHNMPYAATFKAVLDQGVPSIRNILAQSKRAKLTVDDMLQSIGRRSHYDGTEP